MATDEPKTRADGWAGQLFIQLAGWRTETMSVTSDDTVAAVKARVRLPGERLVWGRHELVEEDRTLGSYGVPKEVRSHQPPVSQALPFPPHADAKMCNTESCHMIGAGDAEGMRKAARRYQGG